MLGTYWNKLVMVDDDGVTGELACVCVCACADSSLISLKVDYYYCASVIDVTYQTVQSVKPQSSPFSDNKKAPNVQLKNNL